ncbi:hypothetical protein BV20DRAFT_960014 [Pilatotrama ljubarskyi]|nr:hypothetical protein BV20DRAFT_960014 [Pilatotrama ljubarskyi]
MKLSSILLPSLLCAASASAQYFSAGWSPGQPIPPNAPPAQVPPAQTFERPAAAAPPPPPQAAVPNNPPASGSASGLSGLTSLFDVSRLLTAGPVAALFGKMGVNISEAVARGAASPWDPRIPIITDENFEEVVVREPLTEEEEKERVWFLIISVTAGQNNAISKFVDESFDEAYNRTVIAGDLPNVRWGRIDYLNVTYLTTKWGVWSGPYLVVLTDRGQTLRFYKADRVRITPELLRELLVEELWRNTPPWKTNFAPGGKREWILHYYALATTRMFNFVNRFPRWVLMIASGMIASVVMRILHRDPKPKVQPVTKPAEKETPKAVEAGSTTGSSTANAATTSPSKGKNKQRKNAKK